MIRKPNLSIKIIICISAFILIFVNAELIQPVLQTNSPILLQSNVNTINSLPTSIPSSASQSIITNQPNLSPSAQAADQAIAQSSIQTIEPKASGAASVPQKLVQFDLGIGIDSRVQETDQFLQELEDMIGQYDDEQNLYQMDVLIEMDEIRSAQSQQVIQE